MNGPRLALIVISGFASVNHERSHWIVRKITTIYDAQARGCGLCLNLFWPKRVSVIVKRTVPDHEIARLQAPVRSAQSANGSREPDDDRPSAAQAWIADEDVAAGG